MENSRFGEAQIILILKQAEGGVLVSELCREHWMSNASFFKWRAKYGGMDASLIAEMKDLAEQNRRLKKMYAEISNFLVRLTTNKRTWGFGLCFLYLRNVQGFRWNHKRVYRIYCELELNLRIKPKKRLKRDKPEPLSVPEIPNQTPLRYASIPCRAKGLWTLCMIS